MSNQELLQIYSAYLPYGVKCFAQGYNVDDFSDPVISKEFELVGISDCKWCEIHEVGRTVTEQSYFEETYLLLRPLSDLTKEIEHNGEKFVPLIKMGLPNKTSVYNDITYVIKKGHTPYIEMQKLLEWHFDVFSLIDKNLAINLNEVK